jgi:putative glutamine amidotransferase
LHVVYSKRQVDGLRFDGAILLGGTDIDPRFYGESDDYCYRADRNRDAVEWLIARRCLAERLPVFGICRGHQMLAIAAGGALYQDIEAQGATTWHPSRHKLAKVDRKFGKLLPTHWVNSLHHQAVKTVPFGFRIMARAHDGLVEAIWCPGYLGVQWHPELLVTYERGWITLFEWFVKDGLK